MNITTVIIGCAMLTGCGSINSYVAAQDAAVVKDTKAANDNLVRGIEEGICAVPIGAVIRNSEFVPIAQAACLPAGGAQNPAQLFQNMAQPIVPIPAYQENMNATGSPGSNTPAPQSTPPLVRSVQKKPILPTRRIVRTVPISSQSSSTSTVFHSTLAPVTNPSVIQSTVPALPLPSALPN